MIEEDFISFETAKLLKEKGFDTDECEVHYDPEDHTQYDITIQMAMKWLREVHHILVVTDYVYECTDTSWVYKIYRLGENGKPERCAVKGVSYDDDNNPTEHIVGYRDYELSYKDYATYEEACEAGIKYCLENLI